MPLTLVVAQPHTIGFGFNDNPMGILTWVGEKYNEAAGPENQKKPYWTRVILTTATLYYFTDCIMPSMLCYYENVRHENFASFAMKPENRITIPFGYTSFYWDTEPSSKRAVERTGNLVYYKGEIVDEIGWDNTTCTLNTDSIQNVMMEDTMRR